MRPFRFPALPIAVACGLTCGAATSFAKDVGSGAITVAAPWVRATPPRAPVAGGYLTIRNAGPAPDRLMAVSADFADRAEIHEMSMGGGVMQMRPLAQGVEILPGQSVALNPSSVHIMFMGLKRQLKEGDTAAGVLTFQKAGAIQVEFAVESMGAKRGPDAAAPAMDHQHATPMR